MDRTQWIFGVFGAPACGGPESDLNTSPLLCVPGEAALFPVVSSVLYFHRCGCTCTIQAPRAWRMLLRVALICLAGAAAPACKDLDKEACTIQRVRQGAGVLDGEDFHGKIEDVLRKGQ